MKRHGGNNDDGYPGKRQRGGDYGGGLAPGKYEIRLLIQSKVRKWENEREAQVWRRRWPVADECRSHLLPWRRRGRSMGCFVSR